MYDFIRVFAIILVMIFSMVQSANISVYARSSKYLKEDIEVAAHDAALQIDPEEMSNGDFVIDKDKAKEAFNNTFQKNTGMVAGDYKILTFEIFDDSNSTFPLKYKHPTYDVEDIFLGPSVFAIVETKSNKYFNA
ncbi:hypothetical protein ACFQ8C_37050, partial [Streptomyces sp. NPDC056503]